MWSILATDVDFGPDCALYVSDWVEGWTGAGKGRIYRIRESAADPSKPSAVTEVKELLASDWTKLSTDRLLKLLEHVDKRVRQEAQFELADRHAAKELSTLAIDGQNQLARIHALWALGQMGVQWNQTDAFLNLLKLFNDPNEEIRAQATKVLGGFHSLDIVDRNLIEALADKSPRVRMYAALALGKRKRPAAVEPLVKMLAENDDRDPWLRHAGVMGLVGCAKTADLLGLKENSSPAVRLSAVLALRRLEHPAVGAFLDDANPLVVLEAARAIYDVPIPEALPRLARIIDERSVLFTRGLAPNSVGHRATNWDELVDAFTRRVTNANFRLGGEGRAWAIARNRASGLVVGPNFSVSDCLDALDMFANWSKPLGRDRLLGMWRPIEARDNKEALYAATLAVDTILSATKADEHLRIRAIQLAGQFGISNPSLQTTPADEKESPAIRVAAMKALASIDPKQITSFIKSTLADRDPLVRAESRRLLVKLKPEEAIAELQKALASGELAERQQALAVLEEEKLPGAEKVLETVMDQLLVGTLPLEIQLDVLEAAEKRASARLKEQLAEYQAHQLSGSSHDDIAEYRVALAGGDAERGERIFVESTELSCRRCHTVAGRGGAVGPDLTKVAAWAAAQFAVTNRENKSNETVDRKVREFLLESIVLPNKSITKGYETVIVVTEEGRQFSGIFQSEDDKVLRLLSPDGKPITVQKSSIEVRKTGPSAMPSDLVKHMTKRRMARSCRLTCGPELI